MPAFSDDQVCLASMIGIALSIGTDLNAKAGSFARIVPLVFP